MTAVLGALVLSLFFGRLLHWYFRPDSYPGFWSAITDYTSGGYALMGCFVGCVAAAGLVRLLRLEPFAPAMLDAMSLGGCAGIAVGRLACFFSAADRGQLMPFTALPLAYPVNNVVTGAPIRERTHVPIWPATHYVTPKDKMEAAIQEIYKELEERVKFFTDNDQLVEAQRIKQRVMYDIEMMQELGYCTGIENYSRVISGRAPGSPPTTLLDYFPEDFLLFVDESHVTLPQVRAMYNGDRARKESLVEYGFRLPCAFDNRPLKFPEFEERYHQAVFVSATPGDYEREHADQVAEQVIRPTGLLDPRVEVRPVEGQIDDLVDEIRLRIERNERTLVTTLTKRMAEDLTDHMKGLGLRVRYMHSDVAAIERMEIIRDLRLGEFDVLVGINLLREGLDLPEVSLVAILDADKEGFLRSETSLIQTIGRAARNAQGLVILYADTVTPSMRAAMDETERRRVKQDAYNKAHGIVPQTIRKDVRKVLEISKDAQQEQQASRRKLTDAEREATIRRLEKEMKEASKMLEFEYAALLRDQIIALRGEK